MLQPLGIATQRLLAAAAVLEAPVQPGHDLATGLAVLFQLRELLLLAHAGGLQLGTAGVDACLHGIQLGQCAGQLRDARGAVALHVAVVGEQSVGIGDPVLGEQQLQRCRVALRIGRAQQSREFLASPAEGVFEFAALLLEFRQFRLAGGQFGLHRGECAAGAGDLFVGPAQLASSGATL